MRISRVLGPLGACTPNLYISPSAQWTLSFLLGYTCGHVGQEVCFGLWLYYSYQAILPVMLKESGKALIKPCMVIGMLLSSVSEGILAFVGMLVCSTNGCLLV